MHRFMQDEFPNIGKINTTPPARVGALLHFRMNLFSRRSHYAGRNVCYFNLARRGQYNLLL